MAYATTTGDLEQGRYLFGDFQLDLERGNLTRGGQEIALRPKAFAVLQFLLEHAGQLVAREALLDAVWPGVVVTDDSIAQCLIEIRKALGDQSRSVIRTIPRRGIMFDAPVRFEDAGATVRSPWSSRWTRRGWMAGVVLVAVALLLWWANAHLPAAHPAASPNSIAVLRFTDMSPEGDQAYLGDGLSEEIMHRLAQSRSLRVIARVSSFAVEGQPVASIAKQLGVSHVLEGSVRKQGNMLRVTAQLVDAATSSHIWSKAYDRKLDDILAVQEDIASAVARSLEASLGGLDDTAGVDPKAYELFLEARFFYQRRYEGDRERARQKFAQALLISPEFARAWVGLAAVANASLHDEEQRLNLPASREGLLETERHAVEQALRFGPDLAEAHIRAARLYADLDDREKAREQVEIARSLDPDHWLVRTMLANELRIAGRIDESITLFRQEAQRDPLNVVLRVALVRFLVWAGRIQEAKSEWDDIAELMPSVKAQMGSLAARLQILLGDFNAAATSVESVPRGPERAALLAIVQRALGHQAESDATLRRLESADASAWGAFYAAEAHAYRGEGTKAMELLKPVGFGSSCNEGLDLAESVYYSPFLARLGGLPEWQVYRTGVFAFMRGCLFGLDVDSI